MIKIEFARFLGDFHYVQHRVWFGWYIWHGKNGRFVWLYSTNIFDRTRIVHRSKSRTVPTYHELCNEFSKLNELI